MTNSTRRSCVLAAAVAVTAGLCVVSANGRRAVSFAGDAFGRDGQLRYREFHDFDETPGGLKQVTVYRDAAGQEIGRMEADYSRHRFAPDYRMIDLRHDTEEIVRRDGQRLHVQHRNGTRVRSKTIEVGTNREVIVGPGFNEFIDANWDALVSGKTLVCDFVLPSRLQAVAFRIRQESDLPGSAGHRFAVSVDNVLLRLIAPELHVEYDRQTRALLSYVGLSNVNDEQNRPQNVVIRFPSPSVEGRALQSLPTGGPR